MNARRQQRTMAVVAVVIAGLALAACSSTPASSSAASAQASLGGGGSVAASTTPTATPAPSKGTVAVDLVFTGTLPLTAKGSAGLCTLGHNSADGSILFVFAATEADYPGLGQGLYLNEDIGTHRLNFKWLTVAGGPGYVGSVTEGQGVTYSSDHKSITIDADLNTGISQPTEHVKGTISCP